MSKNQQTAGGKDQTLGRNGSALLRDRGKGAADQPAARDEQSAIEAFDEEGAGIAAKE
jgi:hypothetical protein